MPNRSFCEFMAVKKSAQTLRLELNLIRQFRGLEPILSPSSMRQLRRTLPPDAREMVLKKIGNSSFEVTQCVICCVEFRQKEKVVLLRCKHVFHRRCLQDWLCVN